MPFTVNVNADPPAAALLGDNDEIVGGGGAALVIVNVTALDTLPSGLATVTGAVPDDATSAAAIEAVSCVDETNVVVRAAPFQRTEEPLT